MLTKKHLPNRTHAHYAGTTTTVLVLATDNTAYATLAALRAAGKTPWPGLDAGLPVDEAVLNADNGIGDASAGSVYFATNRNDTTKPVADTDFDTVLEPGQSDTDLSVYNVWFRKEVTTDRFWARGAY